MSSVVGGQYVFKTPAGAAIAPVFADANTGQPPAPVAGQFNLELIIQPNPASLSVPSGYQGAASLSSTGQALQLLGGTYQVTDTSGGDQITAAGDTGNVTITGGNADTIVGGNGNLTAIAAAGGLITGGSGSNFITATVGETSITGGSGPTTVIAGGGDTISAGAGSLIVNGSLGNINFTVGGSSGGAVTVDSGAGDRITGGSANATIFGATGDTIDLSGASGTAVVDVFGNNELALLGSATGSVVLPLSQGGATIAAGSAAFTGTGTNDTVQAGSGTAYINADLGGARIGVGSAGGADTIFSGAGDTITGGAARATIYGASGDTINLSNGGSGTAVVNVFGSNEMVALGSAIGSVVLPSDQGGATIAAGSAVFTGTGTNDTVQAGSGTAYINAQLGGARIGVGTAGGADTIFSGAGDTITGGAASATIYGASGDTINLSGGSGTALVNVFGSNESVKLGGASSGSVVLPSDQGGATIAAGSAVFTGTGTNDTVRAGSGTAYINAQLGGASIGIGGSASGADTIFSGAGDTITGGAASATIYGASGDTINLSGGSGTALVNVFGSNEAVTLGGGSAGSVVLPANQGGATIAAASAAFTGTGTNDTVQGGSGTTYINADLGGAHVGVGSTGGADTILSGAGDTITGGAASATIYGASGDNINLSGQTGTALVNVFGSNEAVTLGGGNSGSVVLPSDQGGATIAAASAAFTGTGGTKDTIQAGSGTAYINANLGNASIVGGTGNATVLSGAGDTVAGGLAGTLSLTMHADNGTGAQFLTENNPNDTAHSGTANPLTTSDTVFGFSQADGDRIIIPTAQEPTVLASQHTDSSGNTIITLPDGSNVTLIGVASVNPTFFKLT